MKRTVFACFTSAEAGRMLVDRATAVMVISVAIERNPVFVSNI
jgi:hypothetical protein